VSIPVELADLPAEVAARPLAPFLLTTDDDGRPRAVAVNVTWVGHELVADVGRTTAGNAAARSAVSVLWAAVDDAGFSLIVDATASVRDRLVSLTPLRAVLHRPAPPVS
jgi:hypothetical protein